jgi:hemerythrin superfamily protein
MRTRFYRRHPDEYRNMVRDICDRLLMDNQADEAVVLQTVRGRLSAEEYRVVCAALDQIAQRSRHIATQLCVLTKDESAPCSPDKPSDARPPPRDG